MNLIKITTRELTKKFFSLQLYRAGKTNAFFLEEIFSIRRLSLKKKKRNI